MKSRPDTQAVDHHRDEAKSLLAFVTNYDGQISDGAEAANTIAAAQAHATLAQADAADRLTAAIERMELPTLEIAKTGGGRFDPQYCIRPKR